MANIYISDQVTRALSLRLFMQVFFFLVGSTTSSSTRFGICTIFNTLLFT